MLLRDGIHHWVATFRVADHQVRRDHLVSHLLAGLAAC
jgi:hypothetical protein